jgi:hypothetical protein
MMISDRWFVFVNGRFKMAKPQDKFVSGTGGNLRARHLEKIRKVTAKRAFEAHDLLCLLRSYYAKSSHGFFRHCGKCIALQHGRRDLARPDHIMK